MKHSKGIPMALIITLVLLVQLVGSAAAGAPNALQSAPSQSGVVDGAGGAVGQHTSIQVDDEGQTRISYYDSGNGDLKYAAWNGTEWEAQTVDSDGDVGQFTSLALDEAGNPRISYYDWANGDLKYAIWSGTGWATQVVDSDGTVGLYTSLALDSAGNPHISYYDATNGDLKYAAWDGHSWDIQTVDESGDVGQYTSLALDGSNHPHISYHDVTHRHLKHATWQGDTWRTDTVDNGGDVGQYSSLAIDHSGRPRIAYRDALNLDLKYAAWTGSIWDLQTVDEAGDVGQYASLALTSTDAPRISFYDATNQHLKYAAWTDGSWDVQTVDDDREVGQYTSIALDSSDTPHISYYDATNFDLRYTTTQDGADWAIEHADGAPSAGRSTALVLSDAGDPRIAYWLQNRLGYAAWNGSDTWDRKLVDENDSVGQFVSLQPNGDDPRISYYDEANGDLKYAAWTGATWDIQTVDSDGDVGRFTSLVLDGSGSPNISFYDVTNGDLKYAAWTGATWDIQTVDSDGDVGKHTSLALDGAGNPHISFFDVTNDDLKYAHWTGSAWNIDAVDNEGEVGSFTSLVLDGSDQPHISYFDATNGHLKYAHWTGSAWDIQTVDDAPQVGSFSSLALDSTGRANISYYDATNGDLKFARWTGSTWDIQVADDEGDVGKATSLALDASGNAHISYYDASNDALKYRYLRMSSGVPDIAVDPESISVKLSEGEVTTVPLTISNLGDAPLEWSISEATTGGTTAAIRNTQYAVRSRIDPALLDALATTPDGQTTFLVYLTEQADLRPAYDIPDWKARGEFVYRTLLETAQRSQKALLADLEAQQTEGFVTSYHPHFIVNAVTVTGNQMAVNRLLARSDVARLEKGSTIRIPDPIREPVLSPAEVKDASAPSSLAWGVSKIRADKVWSDLGITGAGVVVANVDTGVDYTHPALASRYRGTTTGSHDYNWYDPSGTFPTSPGDNHGHGTHTMGTMVGDDGAGNQVGVAPGAQWIAAKGCVERWCERDDLLSAAEWILAPCPVGVAPGNPSCDASKRPQVVNNSWGGGGGNTWYQGMVIAWRAADIFPAFSCGNKGRKGPGSLGSPGDYSESFCSGATDSDDVIAHFSSRGPSSLTPETKPDVSSPGVAVRSSVPGGGYDSWSGTSMASPHTAGTVALMLEANPALSIEEMEQALYRTSLDLGKEGPDMVYGYGRIDARTAVESVIGNDPVPWLSEDPTSGTVAPGDEQVVTVTINANGLSAGTYTADLNIDSNDPDRPTVTVPVTLEVGQSDPFISDIRVSNVRDVSASVSWVTNLEADGQVYYGTDPAKLINVAYDDRGAGAKDDVHHVTLTRLSPDTTYYFYVVSSDARDDNDGKYHQVITGAPLGIPGVDNVWGKVFKSDGVTPGADVLVYLHILDNDGKGSLGQSDLLSGLTDSNGFWHDILSGGAINLAAVRNEKRSAYFEYSSSGGDALRIQVKGGRDCNGTMQVDTANDSPAANMTLSCLNMMDIDIGTGWSVFVWPTTPTEDYNASGLLGAIQDQGGSGLEISRWLPEMGNWSGHIQGVPFNDFDVVPGEPYFLRSDRRSLLRLPAGPGVVPRNEHALTAGWNFVTLSPTVERMTAELACSQIAAQGGAVDEVDRWDAETGNWVGHICGLPFGDFEMTPDEGYFMKARARHVWRPGTSNAGGSFDKLRTSQTNTAKSVVNSEQWAVGSDQWAAVGEVEIRDMRVTNVTDRSFTVSWMTDRPAPGVVRFGETPALESAAGDDRGADVPSTSAVLSSSKGSGPRASHSHHVTLTGLSPATTYYFTVVSGNTVQEPDGKLNQVTTGATLGVPPVRTVYGRVMKPDGETPAAGTLVYVTVQNGEQGAAESAPLSAITDDQGYWSLNLGAARTRAGDSYFTFAEDKDVEVVIDVRHPSAGSQTQAVPVHDLTAGLLSMLAGETR